MKTIHDFPIGSRVRFGRGNGEKTLGTVVKHGRSKLKVRQDEARGRNRSYAVGSIWTVPPSLCTLVGDGSASTAATPAKPKRSEAEILADIQGIYGALSPENLTCDGELSRAQVRRKAANLRGQLRALEVELGRKVSEFEAIYGYVKIKPTPSLPQFVKGQRVAFDHKGRTIVGFVKRVNKKTISIAPEGDTSGRYWRVSPSYLRAA